MNAALDIALMRRSIITAGKRLVDAGLVARSWGNISIRLDKQRCLITPSGRLYNELSEDEIVIYDIDTGAYEGSLKPSSEAGLHARIYQKRTDVNAIIHTHQPEASVLAAAHSDLALIDEKQRDLLGSWVRCAPYALPSTKKLVEATSHALGGGKAVLMANHGALCVGGDIAEAFIVADALEAAASQHIQGSFRQQTPRENGFDAPAMHRYFLTKLDQNKGFCGPALR